MGGCFLGGLWMSRYLFTEALRVLENTTELVLPNILGGKFLRNSFVWNIVSVNALWVWWKCHCNKKLEGIKYNVVDMIKRVCFSPYTTNSHPYQKHELCFNNPHQPSHSR